MIRKQTQRIYFENLSELQKKSKGTVFPHKYCENLYAIILNYDRWNKPNCDVSIYEYLDKVVRSYFESEGYVKELEKLDNVLKRFKSDEGIV